MTKRTVERRASYRYKVAPELSGVTIECRGKKVKAALLETSLGGFTIAIPPQLSNHFPGGELAKLLHGDEVWYVQISGCYREGTETAHLGLRRVADATPMKVQNDPLGKKASSIRVRTVDPMIPACFVVGLLILALSLPGIGDVLGTSKAIEKCVNSLATFFTGKHIPVASSPSAPARTVIRNEVTSSESRTITNPTRTIPNETPEVAPPRWPGFFTTSPQPTESNSGELAIPGANAADSQLNSSQSFENENNGK